jgi:nitrogen regulatory protein P-II 1
VSVTKIEAIIRPSQLDDLRQDLSPWAGGVTVTEVSGHGRQRGHTALYRGAEYVIELVAKVKVELVVPDPLVPRILWIIERSARTRRVGDGKIFVTPVEEAIRVRTGERGERAIYGAEAARGDEEHAPP